MVLLVPGCLSVIAVETIRRRWGKMGINIEECCKDGENDESQSMRSSRRGGDLGKQASESDSQDYSSWCDRQCRPYPVNAVAIGGPRRCRERKGDERAEWWARCERHQYNWRGQTRRGPRGERRDATSWKEATRARDDVADAR